MNLLKQKVNHRLFGAGTIFALKSNKIYVTFKKPYGDKVFPYPKVFHKDMQLENADLQRELLETIAN